MKLPLAVLCLVVTLTNADIVDKNEKAEVFLKEYNAEVPKKSFPSSDAAFMKASNITKYNTGVAADLSKKYSLIMKDYRKRAAAINLTGVSEDTKRQFKLILMTMSSKNQGVVEKVINAAGELENTYSEGCVPYEASKVKSIKVPTGTTCLSLDNQLNPIMAKSRDADELLYAWKGWRDSVGPKVRNKYTEYVRLNNIGARENGYEDAGEYKRKIYEVNDLKESAEKFWNELKPFYQEVHAYVRFKLAEQYPKHMDKTGPIPAHLLGNMWAQAWENTFDIVAPYKDEPELDITPTLEKKHNVTSMFKLAEQFFVSLGWQKLPNQFWTKSMLEKPKDGRNVTCHASAWDFSIKVNNEPDVRVKMCTKIDQDDFITIHHELGHIYYDLLYWNQPTEYRSGANPGFHEAVGDTLALSVQTPTHLENIGLLSKVSNSTKADINFLLKTALERIAFLPFGYLMDQWMWGVYSGEIKPEDYNKKWWEMRLKYQGIKPPVERTENDFDPGAKYHIPADTPYIRYFFAHILQFTFHKYGCKAANWKGDLHKCSIYNSKATGKLLGDMLAAGRSKPWPEALKMVTGSKELSAEPIKEYFAPLYTWLKQKRADEKYSIGWEPKSSSTRNSISSIAVILMSFIVVLFSGL